MKRFRHSEEASGGHALRATLYELALQTEQVAELERFYQEAMGYRFVDGFTGERVGTAADRRLRLSVGAAKSLRFAGYAIDASGLKALIERLSVSGHAHRLEPMNGYDGLTVQFDDPDGNLMVFGCPAAVRPEQGENGDRIARLQHVVFASKDIDAMLTFYREVIGFALSDRVVSDDGVLRTIFLRCGEEHHSLAVFAAPEARLDHWCHEASDWNDIRDWADHFARLDVLLQWGPGRHGPGNNLFVFIHDPDGNWVELSAELELVQSDRTVGLWQHHERTLNSWGHGKLRS